jgi:hypothetical protein
LSYFPLKRDIGSGLENGEKTMKNNRAKKLFQLSTHLVKGFFTIFFGLIVLTLIFWAIGFPHIGMFIFSALFPWIVRLGVMIGCTVAITSLSEAI